MGSNHTPTKPKSCRRKSWSAAEDIAIASLVQENGTRQWTLIADKLRKELKLKGRTGKQCRERWHNHLDPAILRSPWTLQEERTLFEAHSQLGNKWADISQILQGRTDNSIKNHYYSAVRREFRRLEGFEPSRVQIKELGDNVAGSILKTIVNRCQDDCTGFEGVRQTYDFFEDDLPTDLSMTDLEVRGRAIVLPDFVPEYVGTEYADTQGVAEFLWLSDEEDREYNEVFCLPWY
jgi:hypothetical protein